jgi:hypothetical protein
MRWASLQRGNCIGTDTVISLMMSSVKNNTDRPADKRPLARSRSKGKGNNRMDLRKIGLKGMDWIHQDQVRDQCWAPVNTVPQKAENFLTS